MKFHVTSCTLETATTTTTAPAVHLQSVSVWTPYRHHHTATVDTIQTPSHSHCGHHTGTITQPLWTPYRHHHTATVDTIQTLRHHHTATVDTIQTLRHHHTATACLPSVLELRQLDSKLNSS